MFASSTARTNVAVEIRVQHDLAFRSPRFLCIAAEPFRPQICSQRLCSFCQQLGGRLRVEATRLKVVCFDNVPLAAARTFLAARAIGWTAIGWTRAVGRIVPT